jgi:predicted ribosome quality control (RQC) complex YloA/Tae2 family protein
MQVALLHSKAKDRGESEVCVTQVKFVTKARGHKPGQVQISKHKNVFVRADPKRLEILKIRKEQET